MNTLTVTATYRSQLFQLLALGFTHPVDAFHRVLVDDSYAQALVTAAAGAQCSGHFSHTETHDFDDFEADYIHLFQIGRGGKPCMALTAGDHKEIAQEQGRPEFLLEYSGWYRHFGLRINEDEDANELPGHLVCQLEFMAWLAHLEDTSQEKPESLMGYQRAQRDFLQRHLQPYLEVVVTELQHLAGRPRSNPFYLSLAARALEASDIMLDQLSASLATADQADNSNGPDEIAAVNLWG